MPSQDYSQNFLLYNQQNNKTLLIAVEIDGLSTVLSSGSINKRIRYGDPNINYGDPGLVYGGLVPYGDFKPLLQFDGSSLTIQQKIEPEQGRASVTMLSLAFVDLNGFMTQVISPGILIPDILGAQITVRIGFPEISYPEDYTLIFRGRCSQVTSQAGSVVIQLSDPNVVRRQQVFFTAKSGLKTSISDVDTTIVVNNAADFYEQVLGPNGAYDTGVHTYLTIGSEVIEYAGGHINTATGTFTNCIRGARGTTPATHTAGDQATASIQIEDHMIDMALKVMMSGWGGPYLSNIAVQNFVTTNDPDVGDQPQGIVLPVNKDAIIDYGIAPGDYLVISGDVTNPANNGPCRVVLFLSTQEGPNQVIVTDKTFVAESLTSATFSVRSQYDTYPNNCGLQMPGFEVDVARHQYIKNTFLGSAETSYRFYITATESSAKTFLENQVYFPFGCYSLTRFGRMSMQLTHAPIADERLQILTENNVQNPQNIKPLRGVNSRKFFNEVDVDYDVDDAGNANSVLRVFDSDSLNIIGLSSTLPITANGIRTDLTSNTTINRTISYLLSRYKNAAVLINMEVDFQTGILIEAGDVVAVQDGGKLQISNFSNGKVNLGSQLYEVVDRSVVLTTGKTSLQLVSGLGSQITDRYATFSPSTILLSTSTSTTLMLGDSYGTATPGQEYTKWQDYVGLRVLVHNADWSQSATCQITGFLPTNKNGMTVSGLTFAPSAGFTLEVDAYPSSNDPLEQQLFKQICAFLDPTVAVSGAAISTTQFRAAPSGINEFQIGLPVLIHNADFSVISSERNVTAVDALNSIVTVSPGFEFAPSANMSAELIGFPDSANGGGGPYRYI